MSPAESGPVLWVSTSRETPGGMTSFVETMAATPLWQRWGIRFVATHRPGTVMERATAFARGIGQVAWELAWHRPLVVHVHMAKNGSFFRKAAVLWLARARGVPVVLHMHGGVFGVFYDQARAPVRWSVRATLRRASTVIALGDRWAEKLREIAPGARVVSIPNPVRIGPAVRQPGSDEPVHVVFLGKMVDDKGIFVLVDAWAKVIAENGDRPCRLTIAGNGEVDRVRDAVGRLGLESSVDVRPWLSPDQVAELLGGAQVLTLPSRHEGQPMAILEAMARGVCVVATDVGGIPDLVENDVSAVLVPVDDTEALTAALSRVIQDLRARTRLGGAGRDRALQSFDAGIVWRRIDQLYRDLLSS